MKNFTVENMIAAMLFEPTKKGRDKLFEAFRLMTFYDFIEIEVFDDFCEAWKNEVLNDGI